MVEFTEVTAGCPEGLEGLPTQQKHILLWIVSYLRVLGHMPTVRLIMEGNGIKSPNGVICHLSQLGKKGLHRRATDRYYYELTEKAQRAFRTVESAPGGLRLHLMAPSAFLSHDEATRLIGQLQEALGGKG